MALYSVRVCKNREVFLVSEGSGFSLDHPLVAVQYCPENPEFTLVVNTFGIRYF